MRGQGAIEYLTIFTAVLIVFAAVTIPRMVDPGRKAARDSLKVSQARSAADAITNAIDGVYANSQGAVITEEVYLDTAWDLQINNNPPRLRIGVWTSEGMENAWDNLRYGFPNLGLGELKDELSNIPRGSYSVIVVWTSYAKEGIDDSALNDNKIKIYINPGGGS